MRLVGRFAVENLRRQSNDVFPSGERLSVVTIHAQRTHHDHDYATKHANHAPRHLVRTLGHNRAECFSHNFDQRFSS